MNQLVYRMVQGKLHARELPMSISIWDLKTAYQYLREQTTAIGLSTEEMLAMSRDTTSLRDDVELRQAVLITPPPRTAKPWHACEAARSAKAADPLQNLPRR